MLLLHSKSEELLRINSRLWEWLFVLDRFMADFDSHGGCG